MPTVVCSGVGAVSSLGHDSRQLFEGILEGRVGIRGIERFDTGAFQVHLGAEVRDWPMPDGGDTGPELCRSFAVRAGREALAAARLDDPARLARTALLFGTSLTDGVVPIDHLARRIAADLGLGGPVFTVSTACSSATGALGLARDVLAMGGADHVLAGGADVLTRSVFAGFHALGVLSTEACAPFSRPFGTTLGEGAGFMVLESREAAAPRGVAPLAVLSGYGLSADAFHETTPDPEGKGVARALSAALRDACIGPGDIGYINVHGTGTQANDAAEWRGIQSALSGPASIPLSSSKGALGHTQGAAGVLESIVTVMAMRRGVVPPTRNFTQPRRFAPPDPVGEAEPRPSSYLNAVCMNSAFAGSNVALVWSHPRRTPRQRSRHRDRVSVLGVGTLHPGGGDPGTLTHGLGSGTIPSFDVREYAPRVDPRGLDTSSRYLIAATALALRDGGVRLTGRRRDTTGLLVGATRASPESVHRFSRSVRERGLSGLSAAAFARIVLNAAAGACAKAHGIRGPHTVLGAGAGAGLLAVVTSAELLSTRPEVLMMVAAAVDERDRLSAKPMGELDAAAAVLLGRTGGGDRDGPHRVSPARRRVDLVGWGISGPGRAHEANRRALSAAGLTSKDVELVFDERELVPPGEWASPSALALALAVGSLQAGEGRTALVTSCDGRSLTAAVVLHAS